MSQSTVQGLKGSERDPQTPRPTNQHQSHNDSASPSPSGDPASAHGQRKSFSSLSARSSVSLSTSYSSADEHSEVGELPAESGAGDVRVQTERQGSGHSGMAPTKGRAERTDGDIKALEQELADMNVKSGQNANHKEEEEDEDSYLNDPLVKYTLQLHDYTKRMYIEARITHERLQKERSRGGKGGRSGIEAMGRKTAATPRY